MSLCITLVVVLVVVFGGGRIRRHDCLHSTYYYKKKQKKNNNHTPYEHTIFKELWEIIIFWLLKWNFYKGFSAKKKRR